MKFLRHFFPFTLFVYLLFLPVLASPVMAFAQTTQTTQSQVNPYAVPNTDNNVPANLHTGIQSIMIETMAAMLCQLTGIDPTNPQGQCLGFNQKTGRIGFLPLSSDNPQHIGGAIGFLTSNLNNIFILPVRTSDYIAYTINNFGFAKKADAAGPCTWSIGFCGISPLILLWSSFRNIVYFFFAVIFAIVGVAIMLRVKIDPRTVMTVENQIPRIIIALILITFSFAIAGFLIDMMYVSIGVIINILKSNIAASLPNFSINDAQGHNTFDFFNSTLGFTNVVWNGSGAIGQSISNMLGVWGFVIAGVAGSFIGYLSVHTLIPWLLTQLVGIFNLSALANAGILFVNAGGQVTLDLSRVGWVLVGASIGIPIAAAFATGLFYKFLIGIILAIAVLIALIRLFFNLLLAYFSILLDIVLGPFWIAFGVLPGNSLGFVPWLRSIITNLLVFPATIALFILGAIFMNAVKIGGQTFFVPPLLGNPTDQGAIQAFIGIATLFLASSLRNIIAEILKPAQSKYFGQSLTQGFGGGVRGLTGTVGTVGGTLIASREAILRPGGGAAERGLPAAILGRIFRR